MYLSRRKTKPKRKRSSLEIVGFLVLAVIVVAIVWLVFTSPQNPTQPTQTTTNALAPDFTLTDVNGTPISLSDQRGKVVVLEFMRTTCPHCANEMSQLASVHDQFGPDVTIISVSVDPQGDTNEVLKAYAADHNAPWVWVRDTSDNYVASLYGISGVPTIIIIDSNGRIVQVNTGETSSSILIQQIQSAQ
jgi:cytochrome oxidase Cu insertion factor (SCO1/SenC/PrrC family)